MKTTQFAATLIALALLVSACGETIPAPTLTQVPPTPSPSTSAAPSEVNTNPAPLPTSPLPLASYPLAVQKAVKALAARLGIAENQVQVIRYVAVEWPDSCLGVQAPGVMCAMIVTQGYRVVLEGNGSQYEYHTDMDGSSVVLYAGNEPTPQKPGTSKAGPGLSGTVFSWRNEGGIAGLCSLLTITADGRVTAYSCTGGKTRLLGQGQLTAQELAQLEQWLGQYKSFELDLQNGVESVDTPVPDSLFSRVTFSGLGSQAPLEAVKQAMVFFAEAIFNRVARSS